MGLKEQAAKGVFWVFAEQFGSQLIGFVINLVLARVLLPSDFGTIALYGVIMSIGTVLINGGLTNSLIRTQEIDERDLSTVFWFNFGVSLIMYLLIYLIAPIVANFYNVPVLIGLIRTYAIILVIDSFAAVQVSKVLKAMNFKTAFKIQLPSMIAGGGSGIYFATHGYGPWSLVYSSLIQNFVYTLQYWLYSDWRPKFLFDVEKFKYHFSFGIRLTASSLLDTIFNNLYNIIIGKKFSSTQLGYYNRADALKQLPITNIAGALNRVTFPLFAKLAHDDAALKKYYQNIILVVIFLIAPLSVLMVVLAEPIIRFLLTEKWMPAIPYFQILSIGGILYPIHAYNLNILQAKGRSDLYLRIELIKKIIIVAVILCTLPLGMIGLVWGSVIISVITVFINTHYTSKFIDYPIWNQFADLLPSIIRALIVGALVYFIDKYLLINYHDLIRLIISVVIYLGTYFGIAYLLKTKEMAILIDLIKGSRNNKET
ncbi:lipopolysaccharide biosynthesis protein [Sphingobacterium mizutaii NBRC 14946 = DSM 11724]|uniref:Lipopolysaccharide biosynthesis protein wzxC n=2 Tax=Sphingobacterium mizutaii TaxID=1010 RepID=A0AAJ4XD33_9SPHI|nr:lipopolysaccharide biosynthesis protein [Sphingobacterium mizutaii]GEM68196.1 lipopolysaccharide biosynthesis protein [Sphingobacterium mizutaii NBRC 14946 = DSM 11724]SDL09362.1 Membrane protein involved in the export of O-antigen and teichoic acid [Sphingobacterium mizutaii]SNV51375.1 Lipopolysaccharide biosynthesis protein wzxC [Sphingobacterium mizutaii]